MSFRDDVITGSDDAGLELALTAAVGERWGLLMQIQADLIRFGRDQGFTQSQILGAVQDLFETYASEWLAYLLVFSPQLATAITNDATLTWLDLDAGGQTIRARLVGRLS